jgi:TP901 family phage tail tape measure protein
MATVGTLLVEVVGDASRLASTLTNAERTVERFGTRVFLSGTRVAAGVSLPVAGLLTMIGKLGVEFDSAMTESLAIMDNVSDEMRARMEKQAMDLSRTSKFSAKEIAAGYYDLASAGFNAVDALANIGTVTKFAQAGLMKMDVAGEHLAGSVKALGADLIGTSTEAEAMAKVADVLTAANNSALGTVEDFSEALTTRFASGMKSVNMQLEDGVAFLMAYAQQNIKGKAASQQAWMALRDVQSKAITAGQAWKDYGIGVYDANGAMYDMADILDQLQQRMAGFSKNQISKWLSTGEWDDAPELKPMSEKEARTMMLELKIPERSVSALQKVLQEGGNIRKFAEALRDAGGTMETVFSKQGEAIAVKWAISVHTMEAAGIRLFEAMRPTILDFINLATRAADKMAEWADKFAALSKPTREWALAAAVGLAVLGPLMMVIGGMAHGLAATMGVMKFFSHALSVIGLMALRAVDPVRAAANAAATPQWVRAAAVIEFFTASLKSLWGIARNLGVPFVALYGIAKSIEPMFNSIGASGDRIRKAMVGLAFPLGAVYDWFAKIADMMPTSIGSWDQWATTLSNIGRIAVGVFNLIRYGWGQIGELLVSNGEMMYEIWNNTWNEMSRAFWQFIDRFGRDLYSMFARIPFLGKVFEATYAVVTTLLSEMWSMFKTVFGLIVEGSKATGAAMARWLIPEDIRSMAGWLYNMATGQESLHQATADVADEFDRWLGRIGAANLKARTLTGTMAELRGVMTRSGVPISTIML